MGLGLVIGARPRLCVAKMETSNPELQDKLQELEQEYEVSAVFLNAEDEFGVSSHARAGCAYDTSGILKMDTNL